MKYWLGLHCPFKNSVHSNGWKWNKKKLLFFFKLIIVMNWMYYEKSTFISFNTRRWWFHPQSCPWNITNVNQLKLMRFSFSFERRWKKKSVWTQKVYATFDKTFSEVRKVWSFSHPLWRPMADINTLNGNNLLRIFVTMLSKPSTLWWLSGQEIAQMFLFFFTKSFAICVEEATDRKKSVGRSTNR